MDQNDPEFRTGAEVRPPKSVIVAFAGIFVSIVDTGIRFIVAIVDTNNEPKPLAVMATIVVAGFVSAAVFGVTILAISRGWRIAPPLVTLVAIWGASELVTWADALSIVSALAGVAMTVAVWMPSARSYGSEVRRK